MRLPRPGAPAVGVVALVASAAAVAAVAVVVPSHAASALAADWPPFVLVAALCALGYVAHLDGAFTWVAQRCARIGRGPARRFTVLMAMVALVTITLNLDTAVVFVTPVVILAARRRGDRVDGALYGSIVMANASSLLLVGSNLTNLLVLRHSTITSATYAREAVVPGLCALVVTALVVGVLCRPADWKGEGPAPAAAPRPHAETTVAIGVAIVLMVVVRDPAIPVLLVAVVALLVTGLRRGPRVWLAALPAVSPLTLLTLLALSVVAGALGRQWLTSTAVAHGTWTPALVGAGASVVINNLPAASLLAAHSVGAPVPLLIGLDVGPNLFVTGSLAWVLWWRATRQAGLRPSLARAVLVGATSTIVALPAAVVAYTAVH